MAFLIYQYSNDCYKIINFVDDNFAMSQKRVIDLCNLLEINNIKIYTLKNINVVEDHDLIIYLDAGRHKSAPPSGSPCRL